MSKKRNRKLGKQRKSPKTPTALLLTPRRLFDASKYPSVKHEWKSGGERGGRQLVRLELAARERWYTPREWAEKHGAPYRAGAVEAAAQRVRAMRGER